MCVAEVAANFEASHKAFVRQQAAEESRIAAKLKRIEDMQKHPEVAHPPPPAAAKRVSSKQQRHRSRVRQPSYSTFADAHSV